jgi:hypothetical protein
VNIPQNINVRMLMHGSGAKGMAIYRFGNEEHGVIKESVRKNRHEPFVDTFMLTYLPGREFKTFHELCQAALEVTEEQVAAERAKWPAIATVEPIPADRKYQNACRLCPFTMTRRTETPGTWAVHLQVDALGINDWLFELCDKHKEGISDPKALLAALQAEVALRTAAADARLSEMRNRPLDPTNPF